MTLTLPSSNAGAAPAGLHAPGSRSPATGGSSSTDVVAVRRAVDLLARLPQVDPKRIGLVGWSLGARVGAVTAGAEPRLRAVVLMSGGSLPGLDLRRRRRPPRSGRRCGRSLTQIDPLRWIARAHPGSVLLQDGRQDEIVPRAALVALQKAAPHGIGGRAGIRPATS